MMVASFLLLFPTIVFAEIQTAGVSASVVKAQFETSQISVHEDQGTYQLTVELVNSGGLSAQRVSVFVLYPDVLTYTTAMQDTGIITTQGSALGQLIEWSLGDVASGEQRTLTLTFALEEETETVSEKSFSVSIVSPVSIPIVKKVSIGDDTETFAPESGRFQRLLNFYYIRYVSFKRWLSQKFLD